MKYAALCFFMVDAHFKQSLWLLKKSTDHFFARTASNLACRRLFHTHPAATFRADVQLREIERLLDVTSRCISKGSEVFRLTHLRQECIQMSSHRFPRYCLIFAAEILQMFFKHGTKSFYPPSTLMGCLQLFGVARNTAGLLISHYCMLPITLY